jgi:hypothetical protein
MKKPRRSNRQGDATRVQRLVIRGVCGLTNNEILYELLIFVLNQMFRRLLILADNQPRRAAAQGNGRKRRAQEGRR